MRGRGSVSKRIANRSSKTRPKHLQARMLMQCVALLAAASVQLAMAAKPYTHSWDTVASMMAMHGKTKVLTDVPSQADIQFVAKNYPGMITTGTSCDPEGSTLTIEQSVQNTAARIKEVNPAATVGMYWRLDFAMELAECSGFKDEWAAHPEWRLKDDKGMVIGTKNHYYYDYTQPACSAFFAKVLLNATAAKLPDGKPALDYIYMDGAGGCNLAGAGCALRPYAKGVGMDRSMKIQAAKYDMISGIQVEMDSRKLGQVLMLNGMDNEATAQAHVATGAAGSMFDHWSILQFLNRTTGDFNATMMDEGFKLVESKILSNVTTQIKGWVGPVIHQQGQYPAGFPQLTTPAEKAKGAATRFNSELALFLLVAKETDFWIYSWFWGWYDYVGGNALSTVPADFFPEAHCALGAPTAPYQRVGTSWTYRRSFAHAEVFVDLSNRTASKVVFSGCAAAR